MKKRKPRRCMVCRNRTWRVVSGFAVMGCTVYGWRFGIQPDLVRGFVNAEARCVPMPKVCPDYERS